MQVDVKLNIEGSSFAVGRLSELADGIAFQYDTEFLHRGLQIAFCYAAFAARSVNFG